MRLFEFPYRWSRRPFANIGSVCRDWFKEAADILARMRDEGSILERHDYSRYEFFSDKEKREMWELVRADQEIDRKRFGELMSSIQCWWD